MSGFKTYAEIMAEKESSNRPDVINRLGYVGLYQMGTLALKDAGYIKMDASNSNSALKDSENWTGKGDIESLDQFLESEDEQVNAFETLTNLNKKRLKKRGIITDKTSEEEMYGHLAGAHLLGAYGYSKDPDSEDANAVSGNKYFLDVSERMKGAEDLGESEPEFQTGGRRSFEGWQGETEKERAIQWLEDTPDLEVEDPDDFKVEQLIEDSTDLGKFAEVGGSDEQRVLESREAAAEPEESQPEVVQQESSVDDLINKYSEPDDIDNLINKYEQPTEIDNLINKYSEPEESPKTEMNIGEAFTSGLSQGTTFGFGENLTAAAYATEKWLEESGDEQKIGFQEHFRRGREAAKDFNRQAGEDQKIASTAGDVIGGLSTSLLIPGAGLAKGAKLTKVGLGKMVAAGSAEGALAGLGYSEDGNEAEGILMGAALGAGATAGFAGLGAAARKASSIRQGAKLARDAEDLSGSLLREGVEEGKGIMSRADEKLVSNKAYDRVLDRATSNPDIDLDKLIFSDDITSFQSELNKVGVRGADSSPFSIYEQKTSNQAKSKYNIDYIKQYNKVAAEATEDAEATIVGEMLDEVVPTTPVQEITEESLRAEATRSVFRTDLINYMKFVTKPSAQPITQSFKKTYTLPESTEKELKKLVSTFREAQQAGRATQDSFEAFRQHKYIVESVTDIRLEAQKRFKQDFRAQGFSKKQAAIAAEQKWIAETSETLGTRTRKLYETNMMFRKIDSASGLDLELLQNKAYEANNLRATWETSHLANIAKAHKAVKASKYSQEEIYGIMRRASDEGEGTIPSDALEVVEAIKDSTRSLLESSRTNGLNIKDKGQYYLPKRKKTGAEYVIAMEDFYEKNVKGFTGKLDDIIKSTSKMDSNQLEKSMKVMSPNQKEMMGFISEMRKHVNGKLNAASLKEYIESGRLRKASKVRALLEVDSSVLHTRRDTLPDFILDKNIGNILSKNVRESGNLIFMEPVARQLDGRSQILRGMGKPSSADAVLNYRKDITGQFRKGFLNADSSMWESLKLKYGVERVQKVNDYIELMTNAIYPNLVGNNPASWVRNLTQPLTKTIPEMGYYNPADIMKAYGRALKRVVTEKDLLKKQGIISDSPHEIISEMKPADDVVSSVGGDFIRNFNKWSMYMFNLTDDINRTVTAEMAADITDKIIKGEAKDSLKLIKHFPPALQDRALRSIRGFDHTGLQDAITNHFQVQTQLAYGKVGNSEFVRDTGRLFSMMTKWPVAVGTDVFETLQGREAFSRFALKYMGPLILANAAAYQLKPEEGDPGEWKQIFLGSKYGSNWSPINSITDFNATPPLISGILGTVTGTSDMAFGVMSGDEQRIRKGVKGLKSGVHQFVPVVGGTWKMYDRTQAAFREDLSRSDNLLLPEDYDYDN